jgi:hypothetical protein
MSFGKGSTAWLNFPLPLNMLPDQQFDGVSQPENVVLPFFVDQAILPNGRDGIWYYQDSEVFIVEWRTSLRSAPHNQYDYVAYYYYDEEPGMWNFHYYQIDSQVIPVIGSQAFNSTGK